MRPAWLIVGACCLVAMGLGSVHAYSVLLQPLESALNADRSSISLGYSLALVCITLAVFLGPRLYTLAGPGLTLSLACDLAAFGLLLVAFYPSLWTLWLGYGLLFGLGNGLGYGYALQRAASTMPGREGLTMGLVTAAYGLGSALFALPLAAISHGDRPFLALTALAFALLGIGGAAVWLFHRAGAAPMEKTATAPTHVRPVGLWIAYFGIVLAGLMTIGHATGIAAAAGAGAFLWIAPVVFALTNTTAAAFGGVLADRLPARTLQVAFSGAAAAALCATALFAKGALTFVLLALIGASYGATISIFPALIAKRFGSEGPAVYGRVFTAWGVAGLLGPWLAGAVFDVTGGYTWALALAAGLAFLSATVAAKAI